MTDELTTYAEHDPRQYPEELPNVRDARTRYEVKYNVRVLNDCGECSESRTLRAGYADIAGAMGFVEFMRRAEPGLNWIEVYRETRERVL